MALYLSYNFEDFCARSGIAGAALKEVLSKLPAGAWLGGGAVRRTLIGQALDSDFDFFFESEAKRLDWESQLPPSLTVVRETDHHRHWRGVLPGMDRPVDIQAIHFAYYPDASAVIDSFDFTITQFVLDQGKLVTSVEALWDLGQRRLGVHKITYPVASTRRMMKYANQGFTVCTGTITALLTQTLALPNSAELMATAYVD